MRAYIASLPFSRTRTLLLGGVAALALLPGWGFAQTAGDKAETEAESAPLPTMTVSGSRAPEHYRLEETTPQVKLTREVYEHLPTGMRANDVVQRMPGVYTGGGPGENKDVRFRGLDKEYSRVQLDGFMMPDGGEKRELNLDRLPNFLVDEITIIRNPSADMEMDGLAGRLHVKTREIPVERRLEAQGGFGDVKTFGTQARQAAVSYGERFNNKFGLQIAGSYSVEPVIKDKRTLRADRTLESRETENKPNTFYDFFADAAWWYDGGEIHFKPMYQRQIEDKVKNKYSYTAAGAANGREYEDEYKIKEAFGAALTNKHTFANGSWIEGKAGFFKMREWKDRDKQAYNARNVVTSLTREEEDKNDSVWTGGAAYSLPFTSGDWEHVVKTGADLRYRDRNKNKFTRNLQTNVVTSAAKDVYRLDEFYRAAYILDEFSPFDRLTINAGVRFESVLQRNSDADGPTQSSTFNDLLPSVSALYKVTDKFALRAAASRVVNRPKFDEITPYETYSGSVLTLGNPDLRPEKAWAFDTGFDYVAEQYFIGVNLFHRQIKDHLETRNTGEIRTVGSSRYTVQQMQNVGDGTLSGVELEQRLDLAAFGVEALKSFRLTANQTFVRSRVTDNKGVTTPFAQQPNFIGNLILDWNYAPTGTKISVAGNYVGSIERKKYGMDSFDAELYIDAKITQRITDNVEGYFLLENITNENRIKETSAGKFEYDKGGRIFFAGLTSRF